MKIFDEIEQFLPKYLSEESVKNLIENLKQFPDGNDKRYYTDFLNAELIVFQGDGLRNMPSVEIPNPELIVGPVMMISNTCDTDPANPRMLTPSYIYCPIIKLSTYIKILREEGVSEERIEGRVINIKKQFVTNIFYLPYGAGLPEECIVFMDKINHCPVDYLTPELINEKRVFSLSNYGFYLFLFKLGIHFTRIQENVERG